MLKLTTLFSGSHGNCTLIQSKEANILVDVGFSYTKLLSYLKQAQLEPCDIDAILITHEHSDHISSLAAWCENNSTQVRVHKRLSTALCKSGGRNIEEFENKFCVNDLEIEATELCHDSTHCCGFRFFDGTNYTAVVTDTGTVSKSTMDFLLPCKTVLLESNHDLCMLKTGNYYPYLKRRILSTHGHLSNEQSSQILGNLLTFGRLQNCVLGHLSQNNNTSELAFLQAESVVKGKGLVEGKDINIFIADQHMMGKTIG